MKKQEFISLVAEKAGLQKYVTKEIVDATFEVIADILNKGEEVAVQNFGKFSVVQKSARVGVNPQNPSEKIEISARKSPKFTPSSILKESVNH